MTAAVAVLAFALVLNVVMGVCVARSKRAYAKLFFIHAPVPVLIWLRHDLELDTWFAVVTFLTAIGGLLIGRWAYRRTVGAEQSAE